MTRKAEPKVPWIMLAIFLGSGVVLGALGWLIGNWITFGIIGLVLGLLLAVIYMNRRAEKAAFAQIEGRPGASGAALSTMGRGWIVREEPVSVSPKHQDLVFMAIGRPGVVLVTEGPTARVRPLSDGVKRNVTRAVKNVPITVVERRIPGGPDRPAEGPQGTQEPQEGHLPPRDQGPWTSDCPR
jgi:hypothetical protein